MIKWRTIRSPGISLLLPVLKVKRQFDIKIYKLRLITLNNMAGSNERKFVRISRVWDKMDTDVCAGPREPRGQGRGSEASKRAGEVSTPPSPPRSGGLAQAPGGDACIALHPEATQRHRFWKVRRRRPQRPGEDTGPAWPALPLLEGS